MANDNGGGGGDGVDQSAPPEPKRVPPVLPPLPPPPLTGWGPPPEDPRAKAAWTKTIIALVLAPLGMMLCNVLCIPALVLSILALVDIRRIENPPVHIRVLAIVALVLASLGVVMLLGTGVLLLYLRSTPGKWP